MTARACPVCARPAVAAHRPFCSRRCADVDLQRWFSGAYVVPGALDEAPERDEDAPPARPSGSLDTFRPGG